MSQLSQEQLDRIEAALDELLSPEEWEEFQREVLEDEALREAYVEQAWLRGQLRAEREVLPRLLDDSEVLVSTPQFRFGWLWATGIAAVFAALIGIFLMPAPQSAMVATIIEAQNCKWAGSDLPTVEGASLGTGTLALVEGVATLKFTSGAVVTLEAPTTLEVSSAMRCRLIQGSVVADVPESAHGFTVDTPELEVIDLGTRFGVTAGGVGRSQVIVFEGEVEVGGDGVPEPKRLKTGRGMVLGGNDNPGTDQEPQRSNAPTIESEGWRGIPTGFGNGKDSYVRRGTEQPAGHEPLVMFKHTDLAPTNERRAYLTFDLKRVDLRQMSRAELVLDVQPSGLGFSALVPDSTFAVYGLTDEALDHWDESTLNWENAPANLNEGLDPQKSRKLAEFAIKRGAPAGRIVISDEGIAEFLRGDTNDLATLVLVRLSGETDSAGLVHAVASKEHPTAHPPTLRIQTH